MRVFPNPQVEKGVPIPVVPRRQWLEGRKVPVSPWVAWVDLLEVGDSFELDWWDKNTAVRYMKKAAQSFVATPVIGRRNVYRVWRTA